MVCGLWCRSYFFVESPGVVCECRVIYILGYIGFHILTICLMWSEMLFLFKHLIFCYKPKYSVLLEKNVLNFLHNILHLPV